MEELCPCPQKVSSAKGAGLEDQEGGETVY